MSESIRAVTDAELSVLKVLWDRGSCAIRGITEAIYEQATESEYATVQKLLHRLEAKGYVDRDRSSFAHQVRATTTREEFAAAQLEALAEKLSDGSLVPLLSHLVGGRRLAPHERDKLRKLLDAPRENKRK